MAGYDSQIKAADALGLPQRTYAHYETGRSFPKVELLRKISLEFGVEIDWLLSLKTPTFEQEIRQRNIAMENTHKEIIEPLSSQIDQYQEVIDLQRNEMNAMKQRIAELTRTNERLAESLRVKGGGRTATAATADSIRISSLPRRPRKAV